MQDSARVVPRDWIILVILVVAGVVFGRIQNAARTQGRADVLTSSIHAVVLGPASAVRATVRNFDDFWAGFTNAPNLTRENRELKDLVRGAQTYQETVDALLDKIDRLRKMVELKPIEGRTRIAAVVTGYSPHENRLTISVGSRDGIVTNLPVINQDGLVGVVQVVEPTRSQVILITSPTLTVGAVAQRDPPQPGLLRGQTPTRMVLEFVDTQSPLEVGDRVVTSGLSDTIPGGIPIGRIIKVEQDADFGSRRAQVFPNVKVGEVSEVFVLK